MMQVVQIDESELYAIEESAKRLVTDGGCDSLEGTVKGTLGEKVFSKVLPHNPEVDTNIYNDGDGGYDFTYNGMKFDVKTVGRQRNDPALTVNCSGPLRADFYVLAHRIGMTSCRLVGYAPKEIVQRSPKRYHRGRAYHFVTKDKLHPFPQYLS
jgi:hypothetical protein